MGGKKQTQTTGPSKAALPHLNAATSAVTNAYNQAQPFVSQAMSTLQGNLPTVLGQTLNNPTLAAANGYTQDVLGGKYLTGNPYLDEQIANTNSSVADGVNGAIGTRGLTGGSAQTQILARELAKNESNLRYTDYSNERTRMDQAVGSAASLSSAGNQGLATLLAYLQGTAALPQMAAGTYANGIGGLWGNSTTTTKTDNPGLIGNIQQGVGLASSIASIFSDRRLKKDVVRVGETEGGLPVYEYNYIWGGTRQRGVMADDVAALQPWALDASDPVFAKVNYGAIR